MRFAFAPLIVMLASITHNAAFGQSNCFNPSLPATDRINACGEVIASDPVHAQAYQARAAAWFQLQDYDRAIADYTQAIAIDPKYIQSFYGRGLSWERKGRLQNALDDFQYFVSVNPSADGLAAVARVSHSLKGGAARIAKTQTAAPAPAIAPTPTSKATPTPTPSASTETRVALVIGNGAYRNAPRLPNPQNDATDVAAALMRSGFQTIVKTDLDWDGMVDAAIRFSRSARAADVALFYYSGHALQFNGVNYLAPIDAKLIDESDLRRMIRVDDIVADLQQAKNLRILVLDSCRDNPLAEQLRRGIGTRALPLQRGLAKIDAPLGAIIAFATQTGQTADDGHGRNSPFTTAFLNHIEEQEEIGTIFRDVSEEVYNTSNISMDNCRKSPCQ
jgi:tetratricopeptide (TPR) repeat protein